MTTSVFASKYNFGINNFTKEIAAVCSCIQDISVTLREKNMMFWEVSGIGSEAIGPLWNFLGIFVSIILLSLFSLLGVTLVSDSGSWLLSLFLIHKL